MLYPMKKHYKEELRRASAIILRMIPVILSGGSGSRLWPLSREHSPKQFHPLISDSSMLQETAERSGQRPIIICNQEHRFMVAEQMEEVGIAPHAIMLEPTGRNTAPAIAIACLMAAEIEEDATLLIMPADHHIPSDEDFNATIEAATLSASEGNIATLGITPLTPHTGYGYIKVADGSKPENNKAYKVESFTEKPDEETAKQYLASGNHFWNSGIFIFKASVMLSEMARHAPDLLKQCEAAYRNRDDRQDFHWLGDDFRKAESISIDYAVMEKSDLLTVVKTDMEWSDMGSWSSIHHYLPKDDNGNSTVGDVMTIDAKDCHIRSGDRLVTAIGVENLVIVETPDAVMVSGMERSQDVKVMVEEIKAAGREEHQLHQQVHRPWGSYDSLRSEDGFQVKHIIVAPGAKLSLQMHNHRAEHWVVVKGTARVTRGEEQFVLTRNQSTYIPAKTKHRLENIGDEPLDMIEVQSGDYLGEDDIIRFDDEYDRHDP